MILDHVDRLVLPDHLAKEYANEVATLGYLAVGLEYLHRQVSEIEERIASSCPENQLIASGRSDPTLDWVEWDLTACYFHWYSVSAAVFVELVGWLAKETDASRIAPKEYLASIPVMEPVLHFRDKVAAHPVRTRKDRRDSNADRLASVRYPIDFAVKSFHAGGWSLIMVGQGEKGVSEQPRWSLTETHRVLIQRYWPEETKEVSRGEPT